MIKVADYISQRLVTVYGIKHVFLISGGGAMHLNDAFGKQEGIEYICNHHEQASAIAAEGYARYKQELAVVNVTTGPGGINTLNGVYGQWTDSVPVLYLSGQVKYETTIASCPDIKIRELGDQEVDIISMVKPITKYATMLVDPQETKKVLDRAVHIALSGRPGPVWIDIPLNVQGALIDESTLEGYDVSLDYIKYDDISSSVKITELFNMLSMAKRPLFVIGHGIRIAKVRKQLLQLLNKVNIPAVTTFNGFDLLDDEHLNYVGRIGTVGQRSGNFALQNADLVIFLGTRNNIRQVSYNWQSYAKNARKIVIDIDKAELEKPTLKPDLGINADLKDILPLLLKKIDDNSLNYKNCYQDWLHWCKERKFKYAPSNNIDYIHKDGRLNPYAFILNLTGLMKNGDIAVAGNGSACVCLFQAGIVKANQRIFWNSGDASMGYEVSAAIGACLAANRQSTVCIAGDGSVMMNLQELQTIKHYDLPIKIFILNNNGYVSIRQTQTNFFEGRLTGASPCSGVSMPDFIKLANAFNIQSIRIDTENDIDKKLLQVLDYNGPMICEVILEEDYIFTPKLSSEKLPDGRMVSKPLEDMFPFLDRKEFSQNMLSM